MTTQDAGGAVAAKTAATAPSLPGPVGHASQGEGDISTSLRRGTFLFRVDIVAASG